MINDESNGKEALIGTLSLHGHVAQYIDDEANEDPYTNKPCTATFTLSANNSSLKLATNCDDEYAGDKVVYENN